MTTATTTPHAPLRATAAQPGPGTQVLRNLAAEWTKLRSVRSSMVSLLATVVVCVGLASMFSYGVISRWDHMRAAEKAGFVPSTTSVMGVLFGQLVIGSLGVLAMSGEYSTGTIRATLTATPQRLVSYLTKIAVFVVTAFVVAIVTTTTAFLVSQAILARKHLGVGLGDPGSTRIVLGAALFLVAVALLGLGLAAVLRHTAAAISTLFGLMLVLPILSNFIPSDWQSHVNKWLPLNAGTAVMQLHPDANGFAPWTGLAVMFGYALIALAGGALVLLRKDA